MIKQHVLEALATGAMLLMFGSVGILRAQENQPKDTDTAEKARPPNKTESKDTKHENQERKQNGEPVVKNKGEPEQKDEKGGMRQAGHDSRSAQRTSSRNGSLRTKESGRRLDDAEFSSHLGEDHRFRPGWIGNDNAEFRYGGYTFGFLEPWPSSWGLTDDVYVMDIDGGYVLCNPMYPGVTIGVVIE